MPDTIKRIFGAEPMREGEYPATYQVGFNGVTAIKLRADYYGDHSLAWFDVFADESLIASMSARAVAEIHYEQEQSADA